jgi:hypothetical protein
MSEKQQGIVERVYRAMRSCRTHVVIVSLNEFSPEELQEVEEWVNVMYCLYRHNYSLNFSSAFQTCVIEPKLRTSIFDRNMRPPERRRYA